MSRALPFAVYLFHHIKSIDFICFNMVDNISFIIKFPYIFPVRIDKSKGFPIQYAYGEIG